MLKRYAVRITVIVPVLAMSAGLTWGSEPIAVADGQHAGTRVDITELKRTSGDTLTLRFTLVNESGARINPYNLLGGATVSEVHLIDAVGMKKYMTVKDAAGNCVCSTGLTATLDAGKSLNLWARFPAPPADVKEIGIVIPRFMPVDVPIGD
jgi:hypothetical protein